MTVYYFILKFLAVSIDFGCLCKLKALKKRACILDSYSNILDVNYIYVQALQTILFFTVLTSIERINIAALLTYRCNA